MPQTAILCPHFEINEDGAEAVEHLLELGQTPYGQAQQCLHCRKPVVICPTCRSASRLLSRFCRNCGKTLPYLHWPVAGGSWDSALPGLEVGLPRSAQPCQAPVLDSSAHLAFGGILVQVGKEEQARLWYGDRVLAGVNLPPTNGSRLLSACLVGGVLVMGMRERLLVTDLVDALGISPGSASRRRTLPLRGELAAALSSDGHHSLVALSRDQGRGHLQVFQIQGSRLQLSWTRPVDDDGPVSWLSVSGSYLLLAREAGQLDCFALETGELLGSQQLPLALAFTPPLPRSLQSRPGWIVAGTDSSLFRVYLQGSKLESTPLAPAGPGPLFGMGADANQVVVCHGKLLRRIDTVSGKSDKVEVPFYCTVPPWVARNRALVISQEGTLYALALGSSSFQVEHALRLPGNFQGASLAPLYLHGDLWLVDGDGLMIQVKLGT